MASDDTSNDPADRYHAANRVSLRCVIVAEGEDPSAALAEAGILNPIAVPCIIGDDGNVTGGILGDGRAPNVVGTLETVRQEGFDSSGGAGEGAGGGPAQADAADDSGAPEAAGRSRPVTGTLPSAFGMKPLAPVRRYGPAAEAEQEGEP